MAKKAEKYLVDRGVPGQGQDIGKYLGPAYQVKGLYGTSAGPAQEQAGRGRGKRF